MGTGMIEENKVVLEGEEYEIVFEDRDGFGDDWDALRVVKDRNGKYYINNCGGCACCCPPIEEYFEDFDYYYGPYTTDECIEQLVEIYKGDHSYKNWVRTAIADILGLDYTGFCYTGDLPDGLEERLR